MAKTSDDSLDLFQQLTTQEMGAAKVTFGKAHMGRTYHGNVVGGAKSWIKWFIRTYSDSQKVEHRKFLIFAEKMISIHEQEHNLPPMESMDAGSCPATLQGATKGQGISSSVAPFMSMETSSNIGTEQWDVMDPEDLLAHNARGLYEDPHLESIEALQARMLHVEKCSDGDLAARSPDQQLRDGTDHACFAGDIDNDFEDSIFNTTSHNNRHQIFHQLVAQISKEFQEVSKRVDSRSAKPIQVLEVFCSSASELTKQTNQLGYRACRYGFEQGDLSTKEGRAGLFEHCSSTEAQSHMVQSNMRTLEFMESVQ